MTVWPTFGMVPDLLAHVSALSGTTGISNKTVNLEPLFHSAEAFIRLWKSIESVCMDFQGDGDVDGADLAAFLKRFEKNMSSGKISELAQVFGGKNFECSTDP